MCSQHNRARGFGEVDFELGEEIEALYDEIALRIWQVPPVRCCDDAETWDWRAYVNQRRQS